MTCCGTCPEYINEGEPMYENTEATSAAGPVDQREVAFRQWFELRQGFEGMERDLKRITEKFESLREKEAIARKELWAAIEGGGRTTDEAQIKAQIAKHFERGPYDV